MPKAFLKDDENFDSADSLVNFAFISKSENKRLGGVAPSQYREKMASNVEEILEHALCPQVLFSDDFEEFIESRASMLVNAATQLLK